MLHDGWIYLVTSFKRRAGKEKKRKVMNYFLLLHVRQVSCELYKSERSMEV